MKKLLLLLLLITLCVNIVFAQVNKSVNNQTNVRAEENNGENIGYGLLNMAFGLGSYVQGDWRGGLFVSIGEAVSLYFSLYYLDNLDYNDEKGSLYIAASFGVLAVIFGFIRPFYFKNDAALNLALVPEKDGGLQTKLIFSKRI